ncbi:S49 family peptidase [Roseovarius pacificus]|uniref:S49 family peptidase n=1 Tax=Roseovarius pacificus TaxID=337701 RepID=UPI002A18A3FE|nr:S49 family peptidase [Roseovarius pacificus]
MSERTAAHFIGGGLMAVSPDHAQPLMQTILPDEAFQASASASITIERGQRFAVQSGVALVPVRGLLTPNAMILERWLGWATYEGLRETMDELAGNEDVRAIVMAFDTPGGSVMGLSGAVEAVRAAAQVKPVHAIIDPVCASAGYWLASQATEISLSPGAWVGSIGTLFTSMHPVQAGSSGMQMFVMPSSHARAKRPDPTTEEGRALIRSELDRMEADFLLDVAAGRGIDREAITAQLSVTDDARDGGSIFWGADAQERGLVDQLETRAAAMSRIVAAHARKPQRGAGARAMAAAAEARARV